MSEDEEMKEYFEQKLNRKLTYKKLNKKMKLDQCGAASVLIALEFVRIYKTGNQIKEITFPKYYRVFQKEPERKDMRAVIRFQTCPKCGWKTT